MKRANLFTKRTLVTVISSVLLLAVLISVLAMGALDASAAEFNDVNPELTLVSIQGDPEQYKEVPVYEHEDSFTQGDGNYTLQTNSFVAWFPQDDVAFAYKYYGVKSGGDDTIDASVKANYFTNPDGSAFDLSLGAHHPSTGLMFRSGLTNDASFIYVHVRDGGQVVVVYRDPEYATNLYQCTNQNGKDFSEGDYPLEFRMVLKGTIVQVMYRKEGAETWTKFSAVRMSGFRNGVYAGVCAHSGAENQVLQATYSDLVISGVASLNASGEDEGSDATESTEVVNPDEALPAGATVLLRETFTDGKLNNTPEKTENPVWVNFPEAGDTSIKNFDGNRVLYSEYARRWGVAGKETMTDYTASLDMVFTDENAEADYAAIGLIVRHISNLFYGYQNYIVVVQNGYRICVYENFVQKTVQLVPANIMFEVDLREYYSDETFSVIGDGLTHNLTVDCLDNKLTIYFDGDELGTYTDVGTTNSGTGSDMLVVNGMGSVGIMFYDVYGYADNLVVRDLEDPMGGDYDNSIGGNWDEPIPDYIYNYGER